MHADFEVSYRMERRAVYGIGAPQSPCKLPCASWWCAWQALGHPFDRLTSTGIPCASIGAPVWGGCSFSCSFRCLWSCYRDLFPLVLSV